MKILGWLFLLSSISLCAQDVIISPPLSIEPGAEREMVQDHAPVGSLVPAKIDPVDGQLKLGEQKSAEKSEVKSEAKSEAKSEIKLVEPTRYYPSQKYLQFSFGYLNSKWDRVDSSLDNGSTLTDFRIVSDMNEHNQFGFAIEMIHDTTQEAIPENIRILQYKLFMDYHHTIFADKLDWMAGLALSIGDYSIRKLSLNGNGEKVYTKLQSGTIYGLIPSAGLRFYLGGRNSIDISVEYHQYLSKPQSYIGGFAFVPRFSFVF
ncbi:MAG: hypothetical protein PHY93_05330 [Bacteriovorax sp.]|nr:hypothetical protein [Bacteriovorax sp.]